MMDLKPMSSLWTFRRAIFVVAAVAALSLSAQTPAKPWAYTLEERIALRTSAELARQRVRGRKQMETSNVPSERRAVIVDSYDGKTHPELFLPYEVFDELVKLAYLSNVRTSEVVRIGLTPEVTRHGLPADFWLKLEALSSVYRSDYTTVRGMLATIRRVSGAARRRTEEALELKHEDSCRSRAEAYAAAQNEFGRERLDRFLYEVIAVHMFSITDRLPSPELLRRGAEGCR